MKNWFTQAAVGAFALATLALASCEKDEDQVQLRLANMPALSVSNASAGVLLPANAGNNSVTYTWTPLTFSVSQDKRVGAAITYTIEMAKAGTSFSSVASLDAGSGPTKTYTVGEINNALIRAGLTPNVAGQVDVRLRTDYALNQASLYSATTTLAATPYSRELYAFGNFQGMPNVANAPFIQITSSNPQQYDGYLYMPNATNTFKFSNTNTTSGTVYGAGTGAAGAANSFAANGTDISLPGPGQYQVQVNLANNSYTATRVVWGIIGSATPGGWNSSTALTFDRADKKWKGDVVLGSGAIKFRANDDWGINLGADATGKMSYNGPDITAPGAGTYAVVLDLNTPNTYTYSLTKK